MDADPRKPRRMFPLLVQGTIDLDAIKETSDLERIVADVATAARNLIFRELVKPAPVATPNPAQALVAAADEK